MRPRVLLLDEPVAGMNREETEDMARYILDVQEEWGVTVLLVEHDMGMVMDISSHIVRAQLRRGHRQRHARRGAASSAGDRGVPGRRSAGDSMSEFLEYSLLGLLVGRRDGADRAQLRAHLQGHRRRQLRGRRGR